MSKVHKPKKGKKMNNAMDRVNKEMRSISGASGQAMPSETYGKYVEDRNTLGRATAPPPVPMNGMTGELHNNFQDEIQTLWKLSAVLENVCGRIFGGYPPSDAADRKEAHSAMEVLANDYAELNAVRKRLEGLVERFTNL